MDHFSQLSKDEAEAAVVAFEERVREQVRGLSPESFAVEVARRFRLAQVDDEAFRQHPPHFLIHALEANCAYYQQWRRRSFNENEFATTINLWHDFVDPVLMEAANERTNAFKLVQYLYRTQLEVQGKSSYIRFGRALRMFANVTGIPQAAAAFEQQYGLTVRDWIKLVFMFYAGTGESLSKQLSPLGIRRQRLESMPELGISIKSLDGFLAEAARPWEEIGAEYRRVRMAGKTDRSSGPLTWGQRRPILAKYPIMRMSMGYLVPVPPLVLRQLADGLLERFDAIECDEVRSDIGKQFERYVRDLIRFHLPDRTLIGADKLEVPGEQSCDFALDLPDAVVLIECKAVMLNRDQLSENAVINKGAIKRLLDGYVQIVRTAARIKSGVYPANLIPLDKPVIGLVVTLGNVPGADNGAVLDATRARYEKERVPEEAIQSLKHRPQPFDAEAFEYLVLLLRSGKDQATDIFAEKLAANPWHVGEWSTFLNKRIQGIKPVDITFWKQPVDALIEELRPMNRPHR